MSLRAAVTGTTGRARPLPLRGVPGLFALLAALLAPAYLVADTLTTTDGKVFEGRIVERTGDGVHFEVITGSIRGRFFFPNSRIAKLEEGLSPDEKRRRAYEAKKKTLDLATAEGWYRLGLWCAGEKMYESAGEAFQRSIALDASYRARCTLARARMEVSRERLLTARGLLADLLEAEPGNTEARAELARIQQAIDARLRAVFERGLAAYRHGDYVTALGLLQRVTRDADAKLLADFARELADRKEPSLAEMLVTCRLSEPLVGRAATFRGVTPLEKPLLVKRLQALVEAGVRSAEAAAGALAGDVARSREEVAASAEAELKKLARLAALAEVGRSLAAGLKEEEARLRFAGLERDLAVARARVAIAWAQALQVIVRKAVAALRDEDLSFEKRRRAADEALGNLRDALAALKLRAPTGLRLPREVAVQAAALARRLDELRRKVEDRREHLKRLETALDRSLAAAGRRRYSEAVKWFERLVGEVSGPAEGRRIEGLVRRRTGEDLVDLMVEARIRDAYRRRRFPRVTGYERDALDRELARRALRTSARAFEALRRARDAAPGTPERRNAASQAIDLADETLFYLQGRLDVDADLSRRERRRIQEDIDDMRDLIREARDLLAAEN